MIFKKQAGFSLIETMIALGILITAGAGILFVQQNMSKSKLKLTVAEQINSIHENMTLMMSHPDYCTETLKLKVVETDITKSSLNPLSFVQSIVKGAYNASGVLIGPGAAVYKTDVILGSHNLKIKRMVLSRLLGQSEDYLNVQFSWMTQKGEQTISKNIFVKLEKDSTNSVISCLSPNQLLMNQINNQVCKNIGGQINAATGQCNLAGLPICVLTSEPCTAFYQAGNPAQKKIAIEIPGRKKYRTNYFGRSNFICNINYPYDNVNWDWKSICYCGGSTGVACPCESGPIINCNDRLAPRFEGDEPEISEQTYNYCCRPN